MKARSMKKGMLVVSAKAMVGLYVTANIALFGIFGAGCTSNPIHEHPATANYELHEWGVLRIPYCSTEKPSLTTITPSHPQIEIREPVIYVHSKDPKLDYFDLEVRLNPDSVLEITKTYPEADVNGKVLRWDDIAVKYDQGIKPIVTNAKEMDSQSIDPNLVKALSTGDANTLEYKNTASKFLLYEGLMQYENAVTATPTDLENGPAVIIKNNNSYPIYTVFYCTSGSFGYVSRILAGEEKSQYLVSTNYLKDRIFIEDLMAQGFTESESSAFSSLWLEEFKWSAYFEYPSKTVFLIPIPLNKLTYRIPREEYDNIASVTATPSPDKFYRALYVLVEMLDKKMQAEINSPH